MVRVGQPLPWDFHEELHVAGGEGSRQDVCPALDVVTSSQDGDGEDEEGRVEERQSRVS